MSAHVMTNFYSQSTPGGGSRVLSTRFRGPGLVAPETGYDTGGSILDLSVKPAAVPPVTDNPETAPMLQTSVVKADFQIAAAMENLYRLRYIKGAGSASNLGLVKVFGPPVVTVAHTLTTAEVVALGAFTGPLPVAGVSLVCPADHYVVGGRVTVTELFAAPAATNLYIDITSLTGAEDIVDSTTGGAWDAMLAANLNVGYTGVGDSISETLYGPGTAATLYPAGDILIDCTSVGGNLGTFTAGEALIELFCVSRLQADSFEGWIEVAAGTDLSALTFDVVAFGN